METLYGIDKLSFYVPRYALDLKELAQGRNISLNKIQKGLGQFVMSVIPPWEDPITMAVSAAKKILTQEDLNQIDCVIFATESSLDYSKASSLYLHELLALKKETRCIEMKQACYAGTFGLQTAMAFLQTKIHRKILLLCSDVARYGFKSTGESSQGAGAVALLLSQDPKIASVNTQAAYLSQQAYDFWRPNGLNEAIVDGRYSCQLYLEMLSQVFPQYCEKNQQPKLFTTCFHLPVPRLVEKAYHQLSSHWNKDNSWTLEAQLSYSRLIGNCYTGSLYLGLISLLENSLYCLDEKKIGLYSYGSGATCDFFDITIIKGYEKNLHYQYHRSLLERRTYLSLREYEDFYQNSYQGGIDGHYGTCALEAVRDYRRYYTLKSQSEMKQETCQRKPSVLNELKKEKEEDLCV
jgi:hydroxymethylglutaryl-CoA synthase